MRTQRTRVRRTTRYRRTTPRYRTRYQRRRVTTSRRSLHRPHTALPQRRHAGPARKLNTVRYRKPSRRLRPPRLGRSRLGTPRVRPRWRPTTYRSYYRPRIYVRWSSPVYYPSSEPPRVTCRNQFSADYQWLYVCGRYRWDPYSGWAWVEGRWEPTRYGYVYDPGRWRRVNGRWTFQAGGWVADDGLD